jgi:hypothetical protein
MKAERKIPRKEITKDAKQLLKQGNTKQQTFELLVDKYKYSKDVADTIKNIPSSDRIQKYGAWNFFLLFLLIIIEVISLLWTSSSFGILWYGLLIYAVSNKLVKYYNWITFLAIIGTLFSIIGLFLSTKPINPVSIALLVFVFLPTCILPTWLEKRLCPEPTVRKEQYTNSEGEQRMRVVYDFPDK